MKDERLGVGNEVLVEIEAESAGEVYRRVDPEDARGDLVQVGTACGVGDHRNLRGWVAPGCVTNWPGVTHPGKGRYAYGVPQDVATQEDAALARRIAAAGAQIDSAAETELYRRLAPRVRLYGLRHLRDPHAARDLMQHVLLMTLERLRAGKVREPERIASFVLGMCRMVVLEIRRGNWRRETLLATYGDMAEAVEVAEPTCTGRGQARRRAWRRLPNASVRSWCRRSSPTSRVTRSPESWPFRRATCASSATARWRGCGSAWEVRRHDGRTLCKADRVRGAGRLVARRAAGRRGSLARGASVRLRATARGAPKSSPP